MVNCVHENAIFSLKMSAKSFPNVGFTGSSSEWKAAGFDENCLKKRDRSREVCIFKEHWHISMHWIDKNKSMLYPFIP